MKHKKILAGALATIMCFASMVGTVTAYADDLPFVDPFAEPTEPSEEEKLKNYTEIFVSQMNDERLRNGLSEVYIAPQLSKYSQIRAQELTVYLDHDRPDGRECFTVFKDDNFDYGRHAAENISAGWRDVLKAFDGFVNSPKHYRNMMMNPATHFGFGYVYDPSIPYSHFWQMFIIEKYDDRGNPYVFDGQYIPVRELGDVDGTKEIDVKDAVRIQEYSASIAAGIDYPVSCMFPAAADVIKDEQINAIDASIILSYVAQHGVDPDARIENFAW